MAHTRRIHTRISMHDVYTVDHIVCINNCTELHLIVIIGF